jgi:diphthine synthase
MTKSRLTFVGLGLYDEKDISLKGLDEIKNCDKIYAEFYTAKLVGTDIKKIERTIGKPVEVLSRDETEKGDKILDSAKNKKVVFLTCGDPMTATTHVDLRLRAANNGIGTKVIHGSSIATAVPGLLGLQNYKFGRTTTLAFPEKNYFPTSPYEVIRDNRKMGLHTLVLLDIQAEKNRFMTADEGLELLLEMEKKKGEHVLSEDSVVCVVARAGSDNPMVAANSIAFLKKMDFGSPLHTIVVPGNLHFMEIEALTRFAGLPSELGKKCKN